MEQTRYHQARSMGLLGGLKNLTLAASKIIFGISGHSHALLADGIHSLSDLIVDSIVIIASKFGNKAADWDHPYGHGRIETAATVFLALILAIAALGIIINGIFILISSTPGELPSHYVLWIAILSIFLNELLYYWTRHIAKQTKSRLLMTNAWHHRSDSASSFVVALGLMGASLGFPKLDAVAALVVGLMIIKMAWDFGLHSIRELIDTATSFEETEKNQALYKKIPGVKTLHQLRSRSIAGSIFCDVHVLVAPSLSVSEGHYIGQTVESCLMEKFPNITDVTVHIDTENDEISNPSKDLPSRSALKPLLRQAWGKLIPESAINTATLHYQNGKISIEIKLPLCFSKQPHLVAEIKKIMSTTQYLSDIKVLYYNDEQIS